MDGNVMFVKLDSRIDPSNAAGFEKKLTELLEQADEYLTEERLFSPEQKRISERLINSFPERDTLVYGN